MEINKHSKNKISFHKILSRKRGRKKGGSVASDSVNALMPNFSSSPCNFRSSKCSNNDMTDTFVVNNYGSVFKTQGGKKKYTKKGGNNCYDTFKKYDVPFKGIESTSPLYNINYTNVPIENSNVGGKKSKKFRNIIKQYKQQGSSATQNGDSNPLTGSSIPENWGQGVQNVWNGVTSIFTDSASNTTYPSGLQLACNSNDCGSITDTVKYVNNENRISGFRGKGIDTIQNSKGLTFPDTQMEFIDTDHLPAPRAGGGRKKKTSEGGSTSNGRSSDFQTTLASRGPYNYPNSTWHFSNEDGKQVAINNFRAFNKSAPYIEPRTLANGAALISEPPQQLVIDPHYNNPWVTTNNLTGYNDFIGVSSKNFNGAGKRRIIKYKNII